jgi:hypothetical protein
MPERSSRLQLLRLDREIPASNIARELCFAVVAHCERFVLTGEFRPHPVSGADTALLDSGLEPVSPCRPDLAHRRPGDHRPGSIV